MAWPTGNHSKNNTRRELPLRTRDMLRWWRVQPWPSIEWWTGPLDWIYCPAEFFVPTRGLDGRSPATTSCRPSSSSRPESASVWLAYSKRPI